MNSEAWPPPPTGARAPTPQVPGGAIIPPGSPPNLPPPTVHGVPTQPPAEAPPAPSAVNPMRSISGIGRWSQILVVIAALIQAVSVAALLATSPNFFAQWIGTVAIVAHLIAGAVTVVWLYRAASNVENIGRSIFFGPIWAIIGWVLPPLIFIIPSIQLGQIWKASSPDPDWQSGRSTPLALLWGVLYSVCGLAALATSVVTSRAAADELDRLAPGQTVLVQWAPGIIVGAVAAVAAAAVFVALNASICSRQKRLAAGASTAS